MYSWETENSFVMEPSLKSEGHVKVNMESDSESDVEVKLEVDEDVKNNFNIEQGNTFTL